jgi:D-beta-D-heptose 7-phosphate kinase/D-beta-D-heptose 1-phosphate adenosyltransferase
MEYKSWWLKGGQKIVSMDELVGMVPNTKYIVATSGGYDPIHPGHISCIVESKKFNPILVVIVNGDTFLTNKKGKPFQDLKTRCQIVSMIKEVDYVVPFEIENDQTVNVALKTICPGVFTKGGDRVDPDTIPEWGTCKKNDIRVITGVGEPKAWSSSNFLEDWGNFFLESRK